MPHALGACTCCPSSRRCKKKFDKLKTTFKDKDAIVQTTKGNLIRLNTKNIELGLQVNTSHQQLEHKVNLNISLRAEKESMDRKFTEAMAQIQRLEGENAKLREEVKKNEGGKKFFENKASQFEAGKIINQNIIDVVMQSFFTFEA